MKKLFQLLFLLVVACAVLAGCNNTKPTVTPTPTPAPTEKTPTPTEVDPFSGVKFEDKSFEYDGQKHYLEVTNLPEGATVTYTKNTGKDTPGRYEIYADVKIGDTTKRYTAYLTITKPTVTITADTTQELFLAPGAVVSPAYTVSHEGLEVVCPTYTEVGTYTADIYVPKTKYSDESNHVTVNVTVKSSNYEVVFTDATYVSNGTDTYTLEASYNASLLPAGYTVTYTNNSGTNQGYYYAKCMVNDATGTAVETHYAIMTIDYPTNVEFKEYEDASFADEFSTDFLAYNLFLVNPEALGIERPEAKYYSYTAYSDEDYNHDVKEIEDMRVEFDTFKSMKLSYAQLNSLKVMERTVTFYEEFVKDKKNSFISNNYIDNYGGDASSVPDYLEAITFRSKADIESTIQYINSVYDSFMSYLVNCEDRKNAGYPYTDYSIDGCIDYLEGVYTDTKNYYLVPMLEDRISNAKEALGLTDEEVTNYINQLRDAFNNKYFKAHEDLAKGLVSYKGLNKTGYYYASYGEVGSAFYAAKLAYQMGLTTTSMNQYIKNLDSWIAEYNEKYTSYASKLTAKAEAITEGNYSVMGSEDPDDVIDWLMNTYAPTVVPNLKSTPTISITWMDPSLTANTTTMAYYMKSPVDSFDKEFIHLNGRSLGSDKLETVTTIAHEGYPGHLYAYVYTKECSSVSNYVTISSNTGFGEGWAKYVEYNLLDYIAQMNGTKDWINACGAVKYEGLLFFCLYSRVDLAFNYQGWTVAEVASYLAKLGLWDASRCTAVAESFIEALNEQPYVYQSYGYGGAFMMDLHEYAKEVLGDYYDEVEFNANLLSHGWIGLDDTKAYMYEYIHQKLWKMGKYNLD